MAGIFRAALRFAKGPGRPVVAAPVALLCLTPGQPSSCMKGSRQAGSWPPNKGDSKGGASWSQQSQQQWQSQWEQDPQRRQQWTEQQQQWYQWQQQQQQQPGGWGSSSWERTTRASAPYPQPTWNEQTHNLFISRN